jgi:transcriptional regulator GlxA family with amidase domain
MRANTIAVIAFDGISPFHLSVPCMVFGEDRSDSGVPKFELIVCSAESKRTLRTTAGFSVQVAHGLEELTRAKTIIVPSWRDPNEAPPKALLEGLRRAHKRGARIVGLCLGSFVLAAAGLLDRRPATTHWLWADEFARRFPEVQLDRHVLYVDDGDILTSAGTAAGIDCCLHLLRRQCGAEIANLVAPHGGATAPARRAGAYVGSR